MTHRFRVLLGAAAAVCAAGLLGSAAQAQSASDFYKGKNIRIICALGAGGPYDAYARLVARNIGKHLPGAPSVVVENMPGAGGILAANHVYKVAAQDGTVIGALHQGTTLAQAISTPNIEYDARKFNWIGRITSGGTDIHYSYVGKGPASFDDLFKREVVVAGGGPTSMSVILPSAVVNLMGGKLKILSGYKGSAETDLALERGEVDMSLQNWEELRSNRAQALQDKKLNLIVQYQLKRHADLPDVPAIVEKAKSQEEREIWTVMLQPATVGHSFTAGPGVPADRVALLRKAFDAMAADAGLKSEAQKAKMEIDPLAATQVAQLVEDIFKIDEKALLHAKEILGR